MANLHGMGLRMICSTFQAMEYWGVCQLGCGWIVRHISWLQAAGAIHTDFERGFICAEVMHYDELKELGSEAAVKAAGKYRQEVRVPLFAPVLPIPHRLYSSTAILASCNKWGLYWSLMVSHMRGAAHVPPHCYSQAHAP